MIINYKHLKSCPWYRSLHRRQNADCHLLDVHITQVGFVETKQPETVLKLVWVPLEGGLPSIPTVDRESWNSNNPTAPHSRGHWCSLLDTPVFIVTPENQEWEKVNSSLEWLPHSGDVNHDRIVFIPYLITNSITELLRIIAV